MNHIYEEYRAACSEACNRLSVFQKEWREYDDVLRAVVQRDGLREAAEEAAEWVQGALHARAGQRLSLGEATALWNLRLGYLNAVYWEGGPRLAKAVDARAARDVSPDGHPLTICVGSNKRELITVFLYGRPREMPMHGWGGCLRVFPDLPHGRGRRWPRWCPECRKAKTNAKRARISELQSRADSLGS